MPLWLILIAVGIILAIVGFAGVGNILIWIGVISLVVGLIGRWSAGAVAGSSGSVRRSAGRQDQA